MWAGDSFQGWNFNLNVSHKQGGKIGFANYQSCGCTPLQILYDSKYPRRSVEIYTDLLRLRFCSLTG